MTATVLERGFEQFAVSGRAMTQKVDRFQLPSRAEMRSSDYNYEHFEGCCQQSCLGARGRVEAALGESTFPGASEFSKTATAARICLGTAKRNQRQIPRGTSGHEQSL